MAIGSYIFEKIINSDSSYSLGSMSYGGKVEKLSAGEMITVSGEKPVAGVHFMKREEKYEKGLAVYTEKRMFNEFKAADWVLNFCNEGICNTLNISEIMTMDIEIPLDKEGQVTWMSIKGDDCSAESFLPLKKLLKPGDVMKVVPTGGRSSNQSFPFFDLCDETGGVICAIGWSGQWKYEIKRNEQSLRIKTGFEEVDFYLKPLESARSPRILLMPWTGCREDAHNRFRRLMIAHFSPKAGTGANFKVPSALQNFDRYVRTMPYWSTEEGQLKSVEFAAKLEHLDAYWLDAGWFNGDFPYGVGNYSFKSGFPNGLAAVSESIHKNGMKFVVWFEPERVSEGTEVYREHPEWIISVPEASWGNKEQTLFNLGIPEARQWLTALLIKHIDENGIDVYRQDFNIDPLIFWRQADEKGRRGLTEIKHVEALYKLWDDLIERFPGLLIDNCASGGRRIDLETCMRSVPLWRSDTGCSPMSEKWHSDMWNQNQTISLSQYIPYHSTAVWNLDVYEFRSAMTIALASNLDVFSEDFDFSGAREALVEMQRLKKYWKGDFYPLTEAGLDDTIWGTFQFHLKRQNCGMVMLFRRENSPYCSAKFPLKGIDPDCRYKLVLSDEKRNIRELYSYGKVLLEGYEFSIPGKRNSLVLEYFAES